MNLVKQTYRRCAMWPMVVRVVEAMEAEGWTTREKDRLEENIFDDQEGWVVFTKDGHPVGWALFIMENGVDNPSDVSINVHDVLERRGVNAWLDAYSSES